MKKRLQRANCGLCKHLIEGSTFHFNCGKNFTIKHSGDCNIRNVIYVMKCSGCGLEYIGETGIQLRNRVTIHNQQIRDHNLRFLRVSQHLASCPTATPRYSIFPFYKMGTEDQSARRIKEDLFIKMFKPGLNSTN